VYVTGKAQPKAMVAAGQNQKSPENLLKIPSGMCVTRCRCRTDATPVTLAWN